MSPANLILHFPTQLIPPLISRFSIPFQFQFLPLLLQGRKEKDLERACTFLYQNNSFMNNQIKLVVHSYPYFNSDLEIKSTFTKEEMKERERPNMTNVKMQRHGFKS